MKVLLLVFLWMAGAWAQESPTDDIVVKAANAVMFQMSSNLKLTPDQVRAVRPVITDNIIKVRALQQNLRDGAIDAGAMYSQREQLNHDEDQALSAILTPEQMGVWSSIQNRSSSSHSRHK